MLFCVQAYAETQSRLLKADQNQNFLKRETPFLCNVRFRCDLPEVSFCASMSYSKLCCINAFQLACSLPSMHVCQVVGRARHTGCQTCACCICFPFSAPTKHFVSAPVHL